MSLTKPTLWGQPTAQDCWNALMGLYDSLNAKGVSGDMMADGTVGSDQLGGQAVGPDQLGDAAVDFNNLGSALQDKLAFTLGNKQIFYQTAEPTGGSYNDGDVWYDTDDTYKRYKYDAATSTWVAAPVDAAEWAVVYLFAQLFAAGMITADMVKAGTLAADYTLTGTLTVGDPNAAHASIHVTDGVVYIDMYDSTNTKRSSWTYNGLDFFNADGSLSSRIATTTAAMTLVAGPGEAFETPQAAFDSLPSLIYHDVHVKARAGSYPALTIKNFDGPGGLYFEPYGSESVSIESVTIRRCNNAIVSVRNVTITDPHCVKSYWNRYVYMNTLTMTTATGTAVYSEMTPDLAIINCTISNKNKAFDASRARIAVSTTGGSGNTTVYSLDKCLLSEAGTNTVAGTTKYSITNTFVTIGDGLIPSGKDAVYITGTPGGADYLGAFNADGDLVSSGSKAADFLGASAKAADSDKLDNIEGASHPLAINRQNNTSDAAVSNQKIKFGWGVIQGNGTSGMNETVAFDAAFDDVPVVIISSLGARTQSVSAIEQFNTSSAQFAEARSISASGFTAQIYSRDSGTNLPNTNYYGYAWIAIGTKARS